MFAINFRNKFSLHCKKIGLLTLFCLGFSSVLYSQANPSIHLPDYDSKWLHYGFRFGIHGNTYKLKYSDAFTSNVVPFDTIHAIFPVNKVGFSVGFVANFRITDNVNIRLLPGVNFSEYKLDYVHVVDNEFVATTFSGKGEPPDIVTPTSVELPIQIKLKSERRQNLRLYLVAGVTPSFEADGRKNRTNENRLVTKSYNISAEFGVGLDVYNEWYKFSPEIRISRGLTNALGDTDNDFSRGISELKTSLVSIYFLFEGGK